MAPAQAQRENLGHCTPYSNIDPVSYPEMLTYSLASASACASTFLLLAFSFSTSPLPTAVPVHAGRTQEVSESRPDESAGDRDVRWWITWPGECDLLSGHCRLRFSRFASALPLLLLFLARAGSFVPSVRPRVTPSVFFYPLR